MKSIKNKSSAHKTMRKTMRKSHKKMDDTSLFIEQTMNYLATIKIYHWTTDSYATHKATDALYKKLQTLMDTFVEASLGHFDNKKHIKKSVSKFHISNLNNIQELKAYTLRYKQTLKNIREKLPDNNESELINVLDDILTELDVLLYLLTLE
jgi:hypothetical protein